ncbi:type B 50S ribosomal protein L31 [Natronoglycomyces albus]|uniref:Large ribosomal subunit protein bL31B n=1 Tax=Natronoglycomyces albus TaxID=2811108 RepID=A0A895XRZ5_9ACTN|nr:type B 50S ribosomal protein L31 [Natronoglycomyces albus]QSB04398.1 type B 50S ribosomal protein L31 [Natronoglycomyces albus]
MKPGIHPDYAPIIFRDKGADWAVLTRSTMTSTETMEWEDGQTYPVIDVQISAASHPYWTGQQRVIDDEGRVAKFRRRYGKTSS